jgi:hypothetical protein
MRYIKANWKRLLLLNAIGYAMQAAILFALVLIGLPILHSTLVAKGASWLLFIAQLRR